MRAILIKEDMRSETKEEDKEAIERLDNIQIEMWKEK